MFSTITSKTYYIGTKVKETSTGKIGTIYRINILNSNGIRVQFEDKTKKGFFGNQLLGLEIVNGTGSS